MKKLEQLQGFKRLQIHVSIDATGDLYKYMRGYNYTWEQVDDKIKQLHQHQKQYNFKLSLNGTYQLHNMLNLEQFYNWCLQYVDLEYIEMRVLSSPKWLQARHATQVIKQQAQQQLERLLAKYPEHQYFDDIAVELSANQDLRCQKKFVTWNKELDKIRGETYDYNW